MNNIYQIFNFIANYFNQNFLPIFIGFIIGCTVVWLIWRFFFIFVYQDDDIDEKIIHLEEKINKIINHLGINSKKLEKDN
tara:strand:+ start:774 stop:1013 length:240 start_codon:yes stop_codon:yes gene_type:complete